MATFKNWPNDLEIAWSKNTDLFGHVNQVIFFFLPWVLLLTLYLFRRQIGKINPNISKWIITSMGLFAITWELWFDISSDVSGVNPTEQFWGGFDLCRLNMYVVGAFLLFRKTEWVKWVVATALWGGVSTLFNHYNNAATVHSLVTHAIVLPLFPALAITMTKTNYTFKSYVYAHLFNWTIVIFLIATNYGLDRHAGELREDHLSDNALVGWAPYGMRMLLWILVVMVVEFAYFVLYRYIYWQTYEEKSVRKQFTFVHILYSSTGEIKIGNKIIKTNKWRIGFTIYSRKNKFWKLFKEDVKYSWFKLIPYGPKNTYLSAKNNVEKTLALVAKKH